MEINCQVTRYDLVKLSIEATLRSRLFYISVVILVLIGLCLKSYRYGLPTHFQTFLIYLQESFSSAFIIIFSFLLFNFITLMFLYKKNYALKSGYRYHLDENGIGTISEKGEVNIGWELIKSIQVLKNFLIYKMAGGNSFFVPKNCFSTNDEFITFVNLSRTLHNEAKNRKNNINYKDKLESETSIVTNIDRSEALKSGFILFFNSKSLYIGLLLISLFINSWLVFTTAYPQEINNFLYHLIITGKSCLALILASSVFLIIGVFLKFPKVKTNSSNVFVKLNNEGLDLDASQYSTRLKWSDIMAVKHIRNFLYIQFNLSGFIYIPKSAFQNEENYYSFSSFATSHWKNAKNK